MRDWASPPSQRSVADLVERGLAALDDELAAVDVGLQHAHRAVEEERGVVVVGRAGEQLDVEGALALCEAELVDDVGRLQDADLEVVEGRVVVDVLGAADQPVVADHRDLRVGGALQDVGQRRAVDRRDDQRLDALGDHVLDLGHLVLHDVVAVLQVGLVAELLELLGHVVAVGDPALGRLRRHRDADRAGASLAAAGRLRASSSDRSRRWSVRPPRRVRPRLEQSSCA